MNARPYQQRAINRILDLWQANKTAILVMATGGGKTFTAVKALKDAGARRVLWLVHRDYLIDQSLEAVQKTWPEMYPYATAVQGPRNGVDGRFVGATVQTLNNPARLRELLRNGRFTHLIVDETHRGEFYPDAKRQDVVSQIRRSCPGVKVLGLTATPVKANGESAKWLYDEVADEITIQKLVDDGYLVKPVGRKFLLDGSLAELLPSKKTGDYVDAQLGRVMDTATNASIIYRKWLETSANRQTLGFTATIKQAEHLALYFRQQGIRAYAINGKTAKSIRAKVLDAYKRGIIQVVFNAAVLIEGFDAPNTSCIIMARPTQSQALYAQCVGRGLRIANGKVDCEVLNFAPRNGQSLITTEVIYDPNKRSEFDAGSRPNAANPSSQRDGRAVESAPILRVVEADIANVTEEMMAQYIQFHIMTGRPMGKLALKRERFQETNPTTIRVEVAPERQTVLGKVLGFLGL